MHTPVVVGGDGRGAERRRLEWGDAGVAWAATVIEPVCVAESPGATVAVTDTL